MKSDHWNEHERDKVYTQLCESVTAIGAEREPLFLSRVCLLLIEAVGSREVALRAIADAQEGMTSETAAGEQGITYRI